MYKSLNSYKYLCLKWFPSLAMFMNQFVLFAFQVAQQLKSLPANTGDAGLISGSGRCPGEGNGNPLQYSCLDNPMDRGAWWATVQDVAKRHD